MGHLEKKKKSSRYVSAVMLRQRYQSALVMHRALTISHRWQQPERLVRETKVCQSQGHRTAGVGMDL